MALVSAVYFQARTFGFISLDDPQYVSANPEVANGLTLAGVKWAFFSSASFYWHPLTWLSHMLDVEMYGMNAGSHHMTSVALHAASSVILFLALSRLTGARGRSFFVAALFAVHPLHVESVVWIAERKDVLSTLFWMCTLYAYAGYALDPRPRRMALVTILFAFGLMAKPMILTLPFVLLLVDIWPLKRAAGGIAVWMRLVKEKIPLMILAMASVAITVFSGGSNRAVVALERLPLSMRLENAVLSYAIYMKDMLWPVGLAAFYPLLPPKAPSVVAALVVLTVITVAVVVGRRRFPYLLVGWLWYLGTLVPVIGLVQAGDQGRADRFTYVPLIGLFMIIAWGTFDATRRSRRATAALPFAATIVVALSAAAARNQAAFWATDLSLWTRTVAVTQRNYRAENHLGVALSNEGRLSDAVEHYSAALAIWPEYPEAHNNLGTARVDQGRIDDAFHEFSEAVRVRPRAADFHYNLGVVMSMRGDTTGAIREITTASVLDPGSARYQHALDILRHAPGS